jgi:ectoine hydroxylase-related dioxygenase (phytanoyl-CoA dioxygenase family)
MLAVENEIETELPDLRTTYRLSAETRARYRRDGHIMLRGVCAPEEVEAYRDPIVDAAARFNREKRPLAERDTFGKAFLQTLNLWRKDEVVARFSLARRFARIAAELMGVDAVRIYHDQALFKEVGGGYTPWHQDQYYFPIDTPNTITMWMPIVDITQEMGSLDFVSASHREGYMAKVETGDAGNDFYEPVIRQRRLPIVSSGSMSAGDATFHAGWTLHRAGPNTSERVREVMTVIYFADGARVTECDHVHREQDLKAWLPGQRPGELAGTHINPVVYRRRAFDPAD